MLRKNVKTLISYYDGIPAMVKQLIKELQGLTNDHSGLCGAPLDAMPDSSMPSKPPDELATGTEENNTWGRIQEIKVKVQVLQADAADIRGCMDALNGRYKTLLSMKYFRRYSWAKISASMGTPEGTARRWNDRALDRLGEVLEDTPMVEELLNRAALACA